MKRTVIATAGVLALCLSIYLCEKLSAQPTAAPAAPKTRVGLVNLTYVIKNYKKFSTFTEEMKKSVEVFQAKDTALKTQGEKLAKEAQTPGTTAEKREQIEKQLKQIQREIDDNKGEAQKVIVKKQEDQLKILYMDVRGVVERYSQSQALDMVFHYNDALTPEEYWGAQNIARKMQAGALMPLYMANGVDISQTIVQTLNQSVSGGNAAVGPQR